MSAWPSADAAGDPAVALREDFPSGAVQTALVSGGAGAKSLNCRSGAPASATGSWRSARVRSATRRSSRRRGHAPPAPFVLTHAERLGAPVAGDRLLACRSSADGPTDLPGGARRPRQVEPAGGLSARIDTRGCAAGRHRVQVLATDIDGQSTLTAPASSLIDGRRRAWDRQRVDGGSASACEVQGPLLGGRRRGRPSASAMAPRAAGTRAAATATARPGSTASRSHVRDSSATGPWCGQWVSVR